MKPSVKTMILRFFSLTLFTVLFFALVSCQSTSTKNPQKLPKPSVTLSENVASWDANLNAERFEISINGDLSYIENSVTTKVLEDGQTFKIRAIGDGSNYSNSEWSNAVTYTAPAEPTPNYFTVVWKNSDTVLETDTDVPEGTIPEYNGSTPTKANHTFIGWTPEITSVTADVTYQAVFEENSGLPSDDLTNITADNAVYSEMITVTPGEEITIPVCIKNNKGICGFEIIITYDESVLTPKSVISSNVLSSGNFNDSIETSQDNTFSVVWSGTQNITDDVELFVITFIVNPEAIGTTTLNISYNEENTINEDIEEIVLNCYNISITIQSED